jgi:hypothetical protein
MYNIKQNKVVLFKQIFRIVDKIFVVFDIY